MDPVELATSCTMPPVLSKSAVVEQPKNLRSAHLKTETYDVAAVAPYQALPVAGPVITHHKSTALPVVEPHPEVTEEVGGVRASRTVAYAFCCPFD